LGDRVDAKYSDTGLRTSGFVADGFAQVQYDKIFHQYCAEHTEIVIYKLFVKAGLLAKKLQTHLKSQFYDEVASMESKGCGMLQ